MYGENIEIKAMLDELINRTNEIYQGKVKEIILYGSYAKGQEDEESDIDIMVLVNVDEKELRKFDEPINKMIGDISMKYMKVISFVDMSCEKFEKWSSVVPYYKNVSNEGVVLYAA